VKRLQDAVVRVTFPCIRWHNLCRLWVRTSQPGADVREPERKRDNESDNAEPRSDVAASGREIPRGTDEHSDESRSDSSGPDHAGSDRAGATTPDRLTASRERDVSDRETEELE